MNIFSKPLLPHRKKAWINWSWISIYLIVLILVITGSSSGQRCHQMGVDFRGYYASGQIARQHGFSAVYNQDLQKEFQAALLCRCRTPAKEMPLFVAMPYLPFFVILFIPFTFIEFTTSYFLWISLQVGFFMLALYRILKALGEVRGIFRILQWAIGFPLIANLYLGQINALLVIFLVEFVLGSLRGKRKSSGIWLSLLLMKPHTLILLVPGLMLMRAWRVLIGFSLGTAFILLSSALLGGYQGLISMGQLTYQFAGPLIRTAPGMMNWRSLALNLGELVNPWSGWALAGILASLTAWLVLRQWVKSNPTFSFEQIMLITFTLIGTFIVSWHSHFYMHMLLVPLLLVLDSGGHLPTKLRLPWLLGPPLLYLAAHLINPALERSIFGLSMLGLNIYSLLSLWLLLEAPGYHAASEDQ